LIDADDAAAATTPLDAADYDITLRHCCCLLPIFCLLSLIFCRHYC